MSESVALLAQIEQAPNAGKCYDDDIECNKDNIKDHVTTDHAFHHNVHCFSSELSMFLGLLIII